MVLARRCPSFQIVELRSRVLRAHKALGIIRARRTRPAMIWLYLQHLASIGRVSLFSLVFTFFTLEDNGNFVVFEQARGG